MVCGCVAVSIRWYTLISNDGRDIAGTFAAFETTFFSQVWDSVGEKGKYYEKKKDKFKYLILTNSHSETREGINYGNFQYH